MLGHITRTEDMEFPPPGLFYFISATSPNILMHSMLRISRWASLVAALLLANVAVAASVAIEHPDVSESFEETSSTGERTNPHLGAAHSSAENQSITAQNASSLPYETSDISVFVPHGGAHKAGDYAQKLCQWLGDNFPEQASLPVNFSFAQYYPEGSNVSFNKILDRSVATSLTGFDLMCSPP